MSNVNNMRVIISLKKNLVITRFYCLLIIVKTIATLSKVKCSALTLVTILFIFTPCCYLRKDGGLINENNLIISEASDHLRIAAFTCISEVFDFVREKHKLPPEVNLHIWSNGCSGQFRSQYVFA